MSTPTHRRIRVDPICDADGFCTIRIDDGSEHGDTSEQPIATVYTDHDAALITRCYNAYPVMLDALKDALGSGAHDCTCGRTCTGTCTHAILVNAIQEATKP